MPTTTAEQLVQGLAQEGYLIDLNVRRWSGQTGLSEADLGLEGLTSPELHRLGKKALVPPESIAKLTAIESRARARLAHRSYAFPFGGARFVPSRVLGMVLSELAGVREEFNAEVDRFVESYERLAEETRRAWLENARELKARLGKDDAWLANFEARLAQAYPSKVKVRGSFALAWSLYQFALPSGLQIKIIDANKASRAAQLALEAKQQVEAQVAAFVSEAAQTLRQRAADLCARVREQIGNAKFSEKSLNPLRELIQEFKNMDFTGDADFAQVLANLESNYVGPTDKEGAAKQVRDSERFREAFGQALDAVTQKVEGEAARVAQEATERFLRFGNLGRRVAS